MSTGNELRNAAKNLRNIPKKMEKAQSRALKKAAQQTKTETSRIVRSEVNLKKSYVDERLRVSVADAGDGTLRAVISAPKRGMLMTRFPYSQMMRKGKKAGFRVKVSPGNNSMFRHAFLIRLRSGQDLGDNIGMAEREPPDYGRDSIHVLRGPSVSQVFSTFLPTLKEYAAARYETVLQQELRYALRTE